MPDTTTHEPPDRVAAVLGPWGAALLAEVIEDESARSGRSGDVIRADLAAVLRE